jgi:hypothetical protein
MRMAEKHIAGEASSPEIPTDRITLFLQRLETLEKRLESQVAGSQPAEGATETPLPDMARFSARQDLQAEIAARIDAMEERLRRDLGERNDDRIRSLSDVMHSRIEHRLEPIEAELSAQRASVEELREYSPRTDKSLQKLLEGVDKLLSAQTARFGVTS